MSAFSRFLSNTKVFFNKHPMLRGMVGYALIWPTSSVIQQKINNEELDLKKSFRFFLFGTFFVAPTLYAWVKLSTAMFPQTNFKTAIAKAGIEQLSYGPMAGCSFFLIMSLLEGKTVRNSFKEVGDKFPDTWKVGVCFWPFVQTVNFTFIREKNRVLFVSACSFVWTIFLAYMKQISADELHQNHAKNEETHQPHSNLQVTKV